jgi:hypothetical protein
MFRGEVLFVLISYKLVSSSSIDRPGVIPDGHFIFDLGTLQDI